VNGNCSRILFKINDTFIKIISELTVLAIKISEILRALLILKELTREPER
jgi:hypothetical protein